jgi:hypothetical protein
MMLALLLSYFTTADSLKAVAARYRHEWREQGWPVTVEGDLVNEGVVSAFHTREGTVDAVVLRRHAGKTLVFVVHDDLWAEPQKEELLPPLENPLVAVERERHRTAVVPLPLAAARDARLRAWTAAGFTLARETRTDPKTRVLELSKGALVTLIAVDDQTTAVDELESPP